MAKEENAAEVELKRATEHAKTQPLVAIEAVLAVIRHAEAEGANLNEAQVESLFCRAMLYRRRISQEEWSRDPIAAVFAPDRNEDERQFFAACLMRLLAASDRFFTGGTPFALRSLKLFDDVLGPYLYGSLKVRARDQNFEKLAKLRDVVPRFERRAEDILRAYSSLGEVSSVHRSLMELLKGRPSHLVMRHFVPVEILDTKLSGAMTDVDLYCSDDGPDIYKRFDNATGSLGAIADECDTFATEFSGYFGRFARITSDLLAAHLKETPYSKTAEISIDVGDKRYPFQKEGAHVHLAFDLLNKGEGPATEVRVQATTNDELQIEDPDHFLGTIEPGASMTINFSCKVQRPVESCPAIVEATWKNFDKTERAATEEVELRGQERQIDWGALIGQEPYSLEPVDSEAELVGRDRVLNGLLKRVGSQAVGSAFVIGQRRVGKTSVAKTLRTTIRERMDSDYLPLLIEAGEFVTPTAPATVKTMGKTLCRAIVNSQTRFKGLTIPSFEDALAPLSGFLEDVLAIAPNIKALFILDEFDELPSELYCKGDMANAFFQTLRSISGQPNFGFVLVGGENLHYLINEQGTRLNKFTRVSLTYLDRREQWSDFSELIRRPVEAWLDIADEAIEAVWRYTAGHPYFTKWLCTEILELMAERRDSHVTRREVSEAAEILLLKLPGTAFQHFWEDGVARDDPREDEILLLRKRIFLAMADRMQSNGIGADEIVAGVQDQTQAFTARVINDEISDLCQREVLVRDDETYRCKVPLFSDWLAASGARAILLTFGERSQEDEIRLREEEADILPEEITEIVETWHSYRGHYISSDEVRRWLRQFATRFEQRLMFKLLKGLTFYTRARIREKLHEAHGIVRRQTVIRLEEGQRRRRDILVSHLDDFGKSGTEYAKLYADENGILQENVVEQHQLRPELERQSGIKTLVFVDDLVGTGNSFRKFIARLDEDVGDVLASKRTKVVFLALAGFAEAEKRIARQVEALRFSLEVHFCDVLNDSDRAFSEDSRVYENSEERERARKIAYDHGRQLVKNNPLGYEGGEALVIFESSCPNNSLPILWSDAGTWKPLFPRL